MRPLAWLALTFCLVAALAPASRAAANDSLRAQVYTGLQIKNPVATSRVEVKANGDRDTLSNSFDYGVTFGLTGSYGAILFGMDFLFERRSNASLQDYHINQNYTVSYRKPAYEIGSRVHEEWYDAAQGRTVTIYDFAVYGQGTFFTWVGVGATAQFKEEWIGKGALLSRFALAKNQFKVLTLDLNVQAFYEINPNRNNLGLRFRVDSFRHGRFALVPYYQYDRQVAESGGTKTVTSSYIGVIRLQISI